MPSRRDQIKLSPEEVAEFLADERVMNVATFGPDGWPHVTSLWYVMRGTDPWIWTYAKSQKVKNLERDDRATTLIESGNGVLGAEGRDAQDARPHRARHATRSSTSREELFAKYQGDPARRRGNARRAARPGGKRVAIHFEVVETVTLGPLQARWRVLDVISLAGNDGSRRGSGQLLLTQPPKFR